MYRIYTKEPDMPRGHISKLLFIMRLITVILMASFMQVSAASFAQKISMSQTNASLKTVLKELRSQSGYNFVYTDDLLRMAKPVDIKVTDANFEDVLIEIFKEQPLTYSVNKNTISIKEKEKVLLKGVTGDLNDIVVRGIVTDAKGETLPSVSVKVKGSTLETSTDLEGKYSISVPGDAILVFTYIGFVSKEVAVNKQNLINITLEVSVASLNEVVVVGYGTQKRSDLTGAISSIKGSDLTLLPTQRIDQALQGRAAGVMVLNTTGTPGANATIRVRGMNSIQGGNEALVVIDGLQGGTLGALNPDDIESMEILKDASATAIYGARGANGVILITTKTGKLGKPVIAYTFDYSLANLNKKMDLMSAAEYAENVNASRMARNGIGQPAPTPVFTQAEIDNFRATGGTDWQDVIFKTGITQNHQLSVSGATDKTRYRVSTGYLDQEGILIGSGYNRFSLRTTLNTDVTKWLNFNINWSGTVEKDNNVLTGGATSFLNNPINGALVFSPTIPVYDAEGNYSKQSLDYGSGSVWNPLANALEPIVGNKSVRNNLNAQLDFKPLPGLSLKITGAAILSNFNNSSFYNTKTNAGLGPNGTGFLDLRETKYYQNSNILVYDKTISKHHLTFTGVAEQQYSVNNGSITNGSNFLTQQTGLHNLAGAALLTASSSESKRVINSFLGRINYIFNEKYLFTASYRADGSSVFGANNKWGYFPSAAIAWKASEENFIKDLDIFSELKIRGSWGITGNQGISPFQTLANIASRPPYPYNGGSSTQLGFDISRAENPNLRWESTEQLDLGADIGLLKGRLTLTADVYKKTTKDLLMSRDLPVYSGFSNFIDNVGTMENKGLELALSGDPFVGKALSWHSGFNITFNRTTVLDLGTTNKLSYVSGGEGLGTNSPFMYLVEGERFGKIIGYGYEGVWQQSQAAEAAKYGQLPGDPHYTDRNSDGKINGLDTLKIGNAMPDFIFGWNNEITHKNLSLFVQIQGSQGNDIFNATSIGFTSRSDLNRWTPTNTNTNIPGIIDQRTRDNAKLVSTIAFPASTEGTLSRYVEDGSYLRLKNITLAYNLPPSVFRKFTRTNIKIYASATNLLTITKYTGYDPEVSSYTNNDAQIGSDYFNYPTAKTFSFGLNVTL